MWQDVMLRVAVRHVVPMLVAALLGALAAAGFIPAEVNECVRIHLDGGRSADPVVDRQSGSFSNSRARPSLQASSL